MNTETLKGLNKVLKEAMDENLKAIGEIVETKSSSENNWNGSYEIVKVNEDLLGPDVYIKVTSEENSYNGYDEVTGVEFVQKKPKEVVITEFKTID